ncbi:TonB-dependent receptor [Pseudaestuariivita rosea]|uniref:TonB-dependent receptor n=1 Tax=Pseudaestuariivita rosea TaxID=2763263 RepID=UPI001ABBC004|nr:TonB-dependent receptor [Pseudaestuariivita rosea]
MLHGQDEGDFDLGTIVLRGELQERTLQDSPTSAAVETGDAIEDRGDTDLIDVIERTPGVTSSFGEKGFAIRGVDQRASGGSASSLVVSTQVDGVALPTNQATFYGPFSAWDIDQVEVLRGPQSTQQGRNALAGAIIIRSNDPTYLQEFKVLGEVGSRDHRRFALMANTPLVEDTLAFRFTAETLRNEGYVYNPVRDENADERETETYRAKLLWTPSTDVETILSYSYSENFGGEDLIDFASYPEDRFIRHDTPSREGSEHRNLGLRVNWTLSDIWRLETETNLYQQDYIRQEDGDFTPEPLGTFDRIAESEVFEQDIRFRFNTDDISGVVGLFYTEIEDSQPSDFTIDTGFALGGPPNGVFVTRSTEFPTETRNVAIYGEADIRADRLLDGLSFTIGARYDRETFKFSQRTDYSIPLGPPFEPSSGFGETTYEAFLPKLGATYEFTEAQSLSFTFQRGYRAGGTGVNIAGDLFEFDPEYTTNYELAYRGSFYDERLRLSANLYYTDWTDQQVSEQIDVAPTGQGIFRTINAGESELWGGELSVQGEASENLELFASVGYSSTEYNEFISNNVDLSGKSFPNAPEVTAALGGKYRWDNGVSLGVDASYTDGGFFDPENTARLKSDDRWLLNAHLTYERDDWVLGIYGRNLLDEDYVTQKSENGDNGFLIRTGEPQTFGVYVTRAF